VLSASSSNVDLSLLSDEQKPRTQAWGFDFQWDLQPQNAAIGPYPRIQARMEQSKAKYVAATDHEEMEKNNISHTSENEERMCRKSRKDGG
jgi:mitochondrial GTPase 1